MTETWEEISIDEIKSPTRYSLAMGPFGSNIKTDNFVPIGVPIIRGGNLSEDHFKDSNFVFLTEEKADELKSANAFPGDLVFTHRGTLGQVGIIPENAKYPRYVVSQSQMKLSCDLLKVDPYFVYYFFRSRKGQHELLSKTSTTGVPAISSPLSTLRSIRIPYPPLQIQHRIARILSSLDDKIELNRQINKTLEAMARTIFQSWFVDFDPVRAKAEGRLPEGMDAATAALFPSGFEEINGLEIPKDWKVKSIDHIATFLNGLALQNYAPEDDDYLPVIKIAQLHKEDTDGSDKASVRIPPKYVVDIGDVIFSWSGSLEVVIWCGGKGALNQHLFKVFSDEYPKWFYYFWVKYHLPEFQAIASGKATTMGHIQRRHLSDAQCIIPSPTIFTLADKIMAPLVAEIIKNKVEARSLAAIRDTLLPKLMSGEIDLKNIKPETPA